MWPKALSVKIAVYNDIFRYLHYRRIAISTRSFSSNTARNGLIMPTRRLLCTLGHNSKNGIDRTENVNEPISHCDDYRNVTSERNNMTLKKNSPFGRAFGILAGIFVFPLSVYTLLTFLDWYYSTEYVPTISFFTSKAPYAQNNPMSEETIEIVAKPSLGGPFSLTDVTTGKLTTDNEVFQGRWTLLYFGFTRCAEVCPNCMKFMAELVAATEKKYVTDRIQEVPNMSASEKESFEDLKKKIESLRVCFVSVDHIRDNPKDVSKFLKKYNVPSIGLVGENKREVDVACKAWRIYISSMDNTEEEEANGAPPTDPFNEEYQIDHSAAIYLVGPDGKMKDFFFKEIGVEQTMMKLGLHFDNVYGINNT
eukprot:Tbor_TRINITY_DN4478_c0_g1::TRINITY_DN4478_c0_g1_i1::g.7908::m.7908/K07152/SCO1_2; protein SCO1/2